MAESEGLTKRLETGDRNAFEEALDFLKKFETEEFGKFKRTAIERCVRHHLRFYAQQYLNACVADSNLEGAKFYSQFLN